MAYKTSELEKKAIDAIKKNNLVFVNEIMPFLPCSSATFYAQELEKSESIKEALEKNRLDIKKGLRRKWYEGDNATTQIALYKLIGTDEENDRITSQKQTIEHSGTVTIDFSDE